VQLGELSAINPNAFGSLSLPDLKDMAARSHSLEGIGYWTFQLPTLKDSHGEAKIVPELTASANLFDLLGVRPILGRGFVSDDAKPGHNNVLVLGNSVWKEYFHSDRNIAGRVVTINGDPYTVLGVLPPGVDFPDDGGGQEIY